MTHKGGANFAKRVKVKKRDLVEFRLVRFYVNPRLDGTHHT